MVINDILLSPVFVKSCLEAGFGWCIGNRFRQGVPWLDNTLCEVIPTGFITIFSLHSLLFYCRHLSFLPYCYFAVTLSTGIRGVILTFVVGASRGGAKPQNL